MVINLPGLEKLPKDHLKEEFEIHMLNPEGRQLNRNIRNWLKIIPLNNKHNKSGSELEIKIIFEPLKPLKDYIKFVIKKPSTGAWIYKLKIKATKPIVDDIIQI